MIYLTPWILLLPLAATGIQIFFSRRLPRNGDWLSTGVIGISLLLSLFIFIRTFLNYDPHYKEVLSVNWIDLSALGITSVFKMGILLDNLTVLMLMVVTIVSFLVHLYSIGYMQGDPRYGRFFAFLSLFSFSMLGLVLCDNLFAIYIFWELVGVCSYLLIGFWFEKPSAAQASKKAFLTTRVGDIGMFIGLLIIYLQTAGLLHYEQVFNFVADGKFQGELFGISWLTIAGVCLFMGAVGKSAQFPLHIWLPDAMEGPTPVSALIHAATMVAAGVYLVARMFVFFTPDALLVIAYVGGFTALFAASMAITHNDIKKVLAYSTVSQLGYMMLSLGVGAYTAGFFHLVTHAAFKACLFLCSGSVIHALHTNDMQRMGGLRKKMPITFAASLIATLAISGVPLFSGFISKDMILAGTLSFTLQHPQHFLLPIFGFGAAALTAFYMFRLIFLTFFGEPRDQKRYDHAHESPKVMTIPLIVLSVLSLGIFYTGNPIGVGNIELFGKHNKWFEHLIQQPSLESYKTASVKEVEQFLSTAGDKTRETLGHTPQAHHEDVHHKAHHMALILSLLVAGLGILTSFLTYMKGWINPSRVAERCSLIYKTLTHLYWVDEIYDFLLVRNLIRINNYLADFDNLFIDDLLVDGSGIVTTALALFSGDFDNRVIDAAVDGTGRVVQISGSGVRRAWTGQVQQYLLFAILTLLGFLFFLAVY